MFLKLRVLEERYRRTEGPLQHFISLFALNQFTFIPKGVLSDLSRFIEVSYCRENFHEEDRTMEMR